MIQIHFFLVVSLYFHLVINFMISENNGIVFFNGTIEQALDQARDNNKLVFIDAYAAWCAQCKLMERKVFSSVDVGEFYNEHFINLKIDMEKGIGKDLAKIYDIKAYPALIILKPNGSALGKYAGYMDQKSLIEFGTKNLEEWQGRSF